MSDSVQPHRRQPTRLPRPWDSPGKNSGVGCHFLLQCRKVKRESEKWKLGRSVVSDSSRPHGLQPTRLLHPWDFPGKSTGVGCHCLLWVMSTYTIILNNVYLLYQSNKKILKTNINHLKAKKFIICNQKLHFKKTLFSKQREDQIPFWYQLTVNNKICLSAYS